MRSYFRYLIIFISSVLLTDQIKDIDEVRSGFRTKTFGELLKKGYIKDADVNILKKKIVSTLRIKEFGFIYSGKSCVYNHV